MFHVSVRDAFKNNRTEVGRSKKYITFHSPDEGRLIKSIIKQHVFYTNESSLNV